MLETRLNKKGKPTIIRWGGLMYGSTRQVRVMVFVFLVIVAAALSFTQLGFIGVGLEGSYIGYGVSLLAPVALCALLLGLWPGTLFGFIAGCLLQLHAGLQPVDYYELNYITPLSSMVLFTVTAFFLGLLLAIALRKNPPTWRRVIYIILISLFASFMFSVTFFLNVIAQIVMEMFTYYLEMGVVPDQEETQLQAVIRAGQMGDFYVQVLFDAALMFVTCIASDIIARQMASAEGTYSLRTKFRGRLTLVVSLVFMVTAAAGFIVITYQAKETAHLSMLEEIEYLESQLQAHDERIEALTSLLKEDTQADQSISDEQVESIMKLSSLDTLLNGYDAEEDGIIVVFKSGIVVASDDDNYEIGSNWDDYLNLSKYDRETIEVLAELGIMLQITYEEDMILKPDLADLDLEEYSSKSSSAQLAFMCFGCYEDYTIVMITSASKVFASRNATISWVTLSALILLGVVFALVSRLLSIEVVRRIDETNVVLGAITDGDLDARVNISDSREFSSLSKGINTTVDSLKATMAEAQERMDQELSTAKAIQESALPRTFPPFPDIRRFDIYASMQAAREVGGDFYDFFLIGDDSGPDAGKLGFVLADVSGKGVPAALFMMSAKTYLRNYLQSGIAPGEAVENANRQLCDGNDAGMFVTVFTGVLDYATGHVSYVNAGHNPPLLWQDGAWSWLKNISGMPLGLFDGFPYDQFEVDLSIGDEFFIYTDGVTEAMSVSGELYGEERLEALANENFALHPRELIRTVRQSVAAHARLAEQSDDITMLSLEYGVPPEITATLIVPAEVDELTNVLEFVHSELDRRLCPLKVQKQLDIAIEELFVNIARYAYPDAAPGCPGYARVSYTYSAEPPSVVVELADEGIPYNPLAKPDAVTPDDIMDVPIGGLGILMAKHSVDNMEYERQDNSNVLTITKKW